MTIDTPLDASQSRTTPYQLDDPALYLNRDLAWLSFNRRVLHEAENDAVPLLERVGFLSDFGANLDQFFMHRIAGLKAQIAADDARRSVDGRTPRQQLSASRDHVQVYIADEAFVWHELCYLLAKEGIHVLDYTSLNPEQTDALHTHYLARIRPLITPLAIDPERPFPAIANLTNTLIVEAREAVNGRMHLLRIELPVNHDAPRLLRVPGNNVFVPVEKVVAAHLDDLLPGVEILASGLVRVTHSAVVLGDESKSADLLAGLSNEARSQPGPRHTRLEVSADLPAHLIEPLTHGLGVDLEDDVYVVNSFVAARDLTQIAALPIKRLRYSSAGGTVHPRLSGTTSILDDVVENGPLFLHHPYHAYERTVLPLLREAVTDSDVLVIKSTVSRATSGSGLLAPLIMAARRGKQVVIVAQTCERYVRADDEKWARYLESTGITVAFGLPQARAHARATLIVRNESDGSLSRTLHVASGLPDPAATRPNADISVISAESDIGDDATELFNMMTSGLSLGRRYDALLVAPEELKIGLLARIRREHKAHLRSGSGHIVIKANALEDVDITRALYAAAGGGVTIELIIRADCRLRPGLKGLSENVRIVSVLGRYREHGCVYYFRNGGDEEYFVGSADPVSQSLAHDVDVLIPVRGTLQAELAATLRVQLERGRGAWQMDSNGDYRRETSGSDSDAQTQMLLRAQRAEALTRPAE